MLEISIPMKDEPPSDGCQGVTFFLVEEFTHLAFSCAIEPLRLANLLSGRALYRWRLGSADGVSARCSNASVTLVDQGMRPSPRGEMLFILSGQNVDRHITPDLLNYVRRERARGTRIGALCSGSLVLARAGLLNGERAAVHWQFHDSFEEAFPDVELCRNVFVEDSRHPTASGGTAAADLMLRLIETAHGAELAIEIADQMVYNAVRGGDYAQRVSIQARHGMRNRHVAEAIRMMHEMTEDPPSTGEIAERLGITARQLERLFERHMKCSPKKYATAVRLDKARNLLLQTEVSVTEIAHACGFASPSHFARVYRRRFGVTPALQRARPRTNTEFVPDRAAAWRPRAALSGAAGPG